MENKICSLLGIQYPIFQGGMAWIADASLASAVSNAGGLGIIAGGAAPADVIREEVRKAKELTDKPFGVNVMLISPFAEEIAQLVAEEKVKVVTTGAGTPSKFISMWKDSGTKIMPVISSVAMAKMMERLGVDAVIAEGMEAGGHIGKLTTMALIPQVADSIALPVIAAGGIGDGRGMAAAFMLGAQGVQMGTRFVVAKECTVHENYKKAIIKAKDIDSVVTGGAVRCIKNKLAKHLLEMEKNNASPEELDKIAAGGLRRAVIEGDLENGSIMSGQIAGLVKKEQSAEEIILDVWRGYMQAVDKR